MKIRTVLILLIIIALLFLLMMIKMYYSDQSEKENIENIDKGKQKPIQQKEKEINWPNSYNSNDNTLTTEGSLQSLGEQKTAVILYTTSNDDDTFGKSKEDFYREILDKNNEYSFNNFINENSYGKMWLTGVVTPWLFIGSENPFLEDIISAADPHIDYSQIKRIIMIRPRSSGELGIGGNSFVNYATHEGIQGLIIVQAFYNPSDGNPDYSRYQILTEGYSPPYGYHLLSHEFGHSLYPPPLGVAHAASLSCVTTPYKITNSELDSSCTIGLENSDQVGVGRGHYNTIIKEKLGWLRKNQVLEIESGESGTYILNPLETTEGIKVIKIPRVECSKIGDIADTCGGDGKGWYYLEYRRNMGNDKSLFITGAYSSVSYKYDGVEIRIDGFLMNKTISPEIVYGTDYRSSLLIDSDVNDIWDNTLGVGETFIDPHFGTEIKVVELTEENMKPIFRQLIWDKI